MGKWYDYDFGQSRKEKYVGPGTGSITITPDRKGYSKTGSGKRMKISETNTWRRGVDYGIQQARAGIAEADAVINKIRKERNTPKQGQVIVGDSPTYMGSVHPANELSGGWYNGKRGSTEYERKGLTHLSNIGKEKEEQILQTRRQIMNRPSRKMND